MAIEITPKIQISKIFGPVAFLVICIVLFLVLLASYIYFGTALERISQDIQEKEKELIKTSSERLLEQELLLYQSKVNAFAKLLSGHKKVSNVFSFLEEACHPDVWFSNFDFSSNQGGVNVSGQAKDFITLGQQLLILKETESLEKLNLSEISISEEGRVNFSLQLTLDPQIFK